MCQPIEEQGLLSRIAKKKDKVWIRKVSIIVDAQRILSLNSRASHGWLPQNSFIGPGRRPRGYSAKR